MKKVFGIVLVVMVLSMFASCELSSMSKQQIAKEGSLQALFDKVPTPTVRTAQERKLVAKRVERFDVENKLGYVYIFIAGSQIPVGYYAVIGKVASLNSFLVPQQRLSSGGSHVLDDADLDGTYGHNHEGVFFFTDNNVYVEIPVNGPVGYFYTDQPLPIKAPKLDGRE